MLQIFIIGLMALLSIFIVGKLMNFFNQKQIERVWNDDEPVAIQEKKVIKLAAKSGGKVTLPEVCVNTNLSVDQAQEILSSLTDKQVFTIQLTDAGSKVYALADMASDDDKQKAIDLV